MTSMVLLRKLRGSIASAIAMLTALTVCGLSYADQTNILPNTQVTPDPVCLSANPSRPEICLPASWFTEKSSSMSLTYAYGIDFDNRPYIDVKYSVNRLRDAIAQMRLVTNQVQLRKPLAITEWGVDRAVYDLNSQARGDLTHQTFATAQELGVSLIGIYSYDDRYGGIWRGGWDLTDPDQDPRIYDNTTAARVNAAVTELGRLLRR